MKRILVLAAAIAALASTQAQAQPGPQGPQGQQERGAQAPAGDYWRTCRSVSTYGYGDNATMTAQCQDNRRRWRSSSICSTA